MFSLKNLACKGLRCCLCPILRGWFWRTNSVYYSTCSSNKECFYNIGLLKIRVNFKLLHRWHMDIRMSFFCGLHTIMLEIDFKQNESIMENLYILWWQKNLGCPTDHLGGLLGRPNDLWVTSGDLLFYTLHHYTPRTTKLLGGYTGFTPSVRPSVCPSVRPSRMPCPLCIIYSYGWILFILGTNDHYHERVCCAPWPLTLTYIFKVIRPWLRKSCPLCSVYSSGWILSIFGTNDHYH